MTRQLITVDASDAARVERALRLALSGDGPAILPAAASALHNGSAHTPVVQDIPSTVDRRVALVIETSGSTGNPKRVALGADALLASAAASDGALGGPGQWLLALPLTYIAGINVLVRSITAGNEVAVARDSSVEAFVIAASAMGERLRYTSLVPTQLSRLIDADEALEVLRRFDRILVGGQSLPQALAVRALELGLNITRTYGSSETSGGCIYDGVPIGTTQVRISGGRVELAGPMLAEGYLGDPARTEAAFLVDDGRRWYRTDDTGTLDDGVLAITGRADDLIISGGIKVSLAEVELAVRDFAGLAGAVVVAATSAEWGQVPVVVSTVDADRDALRAHVVARLGRAAAPARIVVVDAIPLLSSGKPDRLALALTAVQ